jgi:TolB-like protein/Flp pilus assembly protein TadD
MPAAPNDVDRARQALERVLSSPGFLRNPRMSRFLKFIADRHLEGNGDQLKESVIAVEVFGRNPDHDPSQDSIVRTEAGRLRARLAEYYLEGGKDDAFIIELPKGGYRPVFHSREEERPATPPRETRRRILLIAALVSSVIVLGMLGRWWSGRQSTPVAIAVLPLENLNHDGASDYLADGITDELIRNLSLIDGLSPRSRTSSFGFKGKSRSLREVGKELEVDYIVEGSVLRIGRQLRIDVQLVRVRDDVPVWSGRFGPALTDVLAIQDEVARGIVNGLRLKLARGRRRYETSAEAYDVYLRARALGIQQGLDGEIQSVPEFKESIARDPTFAPAYAGLAAAYIARSGAEQADLADSVAEAQATAGKALELDPLLAEAHGALAMVYARQGEWQRSERSFRRALELDPHDSVTYGNQALSLLMPLGRVSEAIAQLRIAIKNDPLAPRLRFILANALMAARKFDEAVRYCQDLPADFPDKNVWLARARIGQGRVPEGIRILEHGIPEADRDGQARGFLGYAYGRADRRSEAERIAAEDSDPYNRALTFAGLGDQQRTLEALERMAVLGPVRLGRDLTYPEFDLVRGDSRLKQLRNRIGLP